MAGAGWRQWVRETLAVDLLQTYLQDQVVAVFESASARDSVLGSGAPDGMHVYLKSTGQTLAREFGAWRERVPPPGPWITPVISGRANQGGAYAPLRYRHVPALKSVQVQGALSASAAAGTIFTIAETALRPLYTQTTPAMNGGAAVAEATLLPTGAFIVGGTGGIMGINSLFVLD